MPVCQAADVGRRRAPRLCALWLVALSAGASPFATVHAHAQNTTEPASPEQQPALPAAAAELVIAGNRRIDTAAIRAHFKTGADGRYDEAALDAALKRLYATNLFADVKIVRAGGRILVNVTENPTIGRLAFEGNRKIKDADLTKAIKSKSGGPLSRAFIHDDVETILEIYKANGYFNVKIVPKTIARPGGEHSDLVYEITEGEKLAVREIHFAGNDGISTSKLASVVKTGKSNILSFLTNNDIYDADRIESDRALILKYYRAHGYADAHVRTEASYREDSHGVGVVVTFTIEEGPQYRLGTVTVQSNVANVAPADVAGDLVTHEGDLYDGGAIDKSIDKAALGLAGRGAPFATVSVASDRQPHARLINLVYTVDGGKRLYVERIDIRGNTKTHDEVIRRELDFGEGDAYNRAMIDRGQRKLERLGYFKSVKFTTEPGSAPDRIVVDVNVEEGKTGEFFVTGGYAASTGPTVQITIGDSNFMGTGDSVKSAMTLGQYTKGFDVGITDPYALGPHWSLGVDLFGNATTASSYQAFDTTLFGAKVSTGTQLTDQVSTGWNYSIYNQAVTLNPAYGTATVPIQQAAAAGPQWISSIGNGVTYSTVDNPRNPTNGVRVQAGTELAGLGGAAKFAKTTADARYYHEIFGDVVGMVRSQGGYATGYGGQKLPLLNGFFGGPQLIRGFAPNGFGPRDLAAGTTQDNIGGNIYWTTTAELASPIPYIPPEAQLKFALFADAGSLWATNSSSAASLASTQPIGNSHAIRASIGTSLIWDSMFGPVRIDYAVPIAKQSYDVTQRFSFSAGGF
jgi:outer membrane protein insertion porin family